MTWALAGVAIGIAGAFGATRLLSDLLFGIRATDPYVLCAVSALLFAVALLASYIPARRACAWIRWLLYDTSNCNESQLRCADSECPMLFC
jgi:hypothetical protein